MNVDELKSQLEAAQFAAASHLRTVEQQAKIIAGMQAAPIQSGDVRNQAGEVEAALNEFFPLTTSPHSSVQMRRSDERIAFSKGYRAALASTPSAAMQGQGVPEGWKLVPTHPDQAMLAAFFAEYHRKGGSESGCYHAMLAAAPTPPAAQPQAGGRELTDADIERIDHEILADKRVRGNYCRRFARAIEAHITGTKGATG